MECLEISKNKAVKSIPSYFGGDDEEDIPDMADFEEPDNIIENDPVSFLAIELSFVVQYFVRKIMYRWFLVFMQVVQSCHVEPLIKHYHVEFFYYCKYTEVHPLVDDAIVFWTWWCIYIAFKVHTRLGF